jgi:hypothetical protein
VPWHCYFAASARGGACDRRLAAAVVVRGKCGACNRRRYQMAVATGQGLGLVEPVLDDLAALAAHGFVGLWRTTAAKATLGLSASIA